MVYTINGEQLTRRKLVTIDGSQVTTQTGIPLMLNIDLPNVATDGKDVRLAKLDGTPIAREIECVDVPNTDSVAIYYPFNTVASTDSQFYVYWGNASLSEPAEDSTYGSEAVWDSNDKAVYLMNNDPSGSAPQLLDSTSNDNDGASGGSMTSDDLIDSNYGKEIDFEGTDDYIDIGLPFGSNSVGTKAITLKLNPDTVGDAYFVSNYHATGDGMSILYNSDKKIGISWTGVVNAVKTTATIELSVDNVITCVFSAGATGGKIYINGNLSVEGNLGTEATSANKLRMSGRWISENSGSAVLYNGQIGHAVFSNLVPTANYISTTHKNLNNPTAGGTDPFYLTFSEPQHQRRVPTFIN